MTQDGLRTWCQTYMGFEIHEKRGWYVGLLQRSNDWKVFEAESRSVLEVKIRRWWGVH